MRIQGIATRDTIRKTVERTNPRPNEDPTLVIHETVVLDMSIGQTITLNEWGDKPTFDAKERDEVDVVVTSLKFGTYGLQATIKPLTPKAVTSAA